MTSPIIIMSCAVMDWGGFSAGDPNNQAFTITVVITISHVKIMVIMPILPLFHPLQVNNSV